MTGEGLRMTGEWTQNDKRGRRGGVATARVLCRGPLWGRDVANPRHEEHAVATNTELCGCIYLASARRGVSRCFSPHRRAACHEAPDATERNPQYTPARRVLKRGKTRGEGPTEYLKMGSWASHSTLSSQPRDNHPTPKLHLCCLVRQAGSHGWCGPNRGFFWVRQGTIKRAASPRSIPRTD